jgi:5,10-methylenetetrahydrofolate reductase
MATVVEKRAQDPNAVVFICDFSPPRGPGPAALRPAQHMDADFISVAYNPGRTTRVNSAFAALWIKENTGKDVIFNLATRDMNKVALQSLLLGADLMGLQNALVMKGDGFTDKDRAVTMAVDDFTPTELLRSIASMNEGLDFKGGKLREPTGICAGATIDLGRGVGRVIGLAHTKTEAGAQFFMMQAVHDPWPVTEFLEGYAKTWGRALEVPLFCGIQVLAEESIVFGEVPRWITDDLGRGRPGDDIALQVLNRFVEAGFRSIYLIAPILRGGRRDYDAAQRVIEGFRA